MSLSTEAPLLTEIKIEKDIEIVEDEGKVSLSLRSASQMVAICNELVAKGHAPHLVFSVLNHLQVDDAKSATKALVKAKNGWLHRFIKSGDNKCLICNDLYNNHIESKKVAASDVVQACDKPMAWDDSEGLRTAVECKICFEGVPLDSGFYLTCGHVYCKGCIKGFLEVKIENRELLELKCPEEGCKKRFGKNEIEMLCATGVYQKYLDFKLDHDISLNDKIKWCPASGCGRYIANPKGKPRVRCDCGAEMCFRCGEKWHRGNCDTNSYGLYKTWARGRPIQRCPKCLIRIEKHEGCPHMTCTNCGYEWCWSCGFRYASSVHNKGPFFYCIKFHGEYVDYTLGRLTLMSVLLFVISPFLCVWKSFGFFMEKCLKILDDECCYDRLPCVFKLLLLIISVIICIIPVIVFSAIMMLPVIGFRFYCMMPVSYTHLTLPTSDLV
eukprot:TRINITY_DN4201_c0_g1_i10.p1 TRINITY_DN4201_c0_g1~~TRINITY_DN4201_c0_g1_i10.p1  ORF type:complete len:440 (-),score=43.69 TRINITY_DN4201_c0_g1_i10:18-1337(-)